MPKKTVRGTGAADRGPDERRVMLAVTDLASHIGMKAACSAFSFNPGFVYRDRAKCRRVLSPRRLTVRPRPPLAFSFAEQERLLGDSTASALPMWRRRRSSPRCWTKGVITALFAPCTAFWLCRARPASGAVSAVTLSIASRNCLQCGRIKCGRGI